MISRIQKETALRQLIVPVGIIFCALIFAFAAKICLSWGFSWRCPLITATGIPCPSCGSTRAFAALAEIDVLSALRFNPLVIGGLFALPLRSFVQHLPPGLKRYGWAIFGTAVVLNWVYLFLFLPR